MLSGKSANRRGSFTINNMLTVDWIKTPSDTTFENYLEQIDMDIPMQWTRDIIEENSLAGCSLHELRKVMQQEGEKIIERKVRDAAIHGVFETFQELHDYSYSYVERDKTVKQEPHSIDDRGGRRYMGKSVCIQQIEPISEEETLVVYHSDIFHLFRDKMNLHITPITECDFKSRKEVADNPDKVKMCIMRLMEERQVYVYTNIGDYFFDYFEDWLQGEISTAVVGSGVCQSGVDDYPRWWIDEGFYDDGGAKRYNLERNEVETYWKEYGWVTEKEFNSRRLQELRDSGKRMLIG